MASDIRNTASIIQYTYFSAGRPKIGGPLSDDAINQYLIPSVKLEKACSVVGYEGSIGVDLDESIKLTYIVSNISQAQINYNVITIEDSILTSPYIMIVGQETGGTHAGNTITIAPAGGLDPGDFAAYEIVIKITAPSAPTNILGTTAVGTFKTATGQSNLDNSTCDLNYNHAELTIVKENNPSGTVIHDQNIQYTITITNIGNVTATIPTGSFVDLIPDNTEFVSIDQDDGDYFQYETTDPDAIRNKKDIPINHGIANRITLKFTVKTLDQAL